MTKNEQWWLLILAVIAWYLWSQKHNTPQQIAADGHEPIERS